MTIIIPFFLLLLFDTTTNTTITTTFAFVHPSFIPIQRTTFKRFGTLKESGDLSSSSSSSPKPENNTSLDIPQLVEEISSTSSLPNGEEEQQFVIDGSLDDDEDDDDEEETRDSRWMKEAIALANSCGGERGDLSPYPNPMGGAVLVTPDDRVIGKGFSTYAQDCVQSAISNAGITATPLREWCVAWPSNRQLREDLSRCTLYLTLEPCAERRGEVLPPMTQLIISSGIGRVVIGCQDPIADRATKGAATLHTAGLSVTMGVEQESCLSLISTYIALCNTKLHNLSRKHLKQRGRPIGLLHCSVIDSEDEAAYSRNGNAFGKDFGGGQLLSTRDFGSYELAPPPESVWAADDEDDDVDDDDDDDDEDDRMEEYEYDDSFIMDFEEEEQSSNGLSQNPMMPWYEQVSAVVATYPRPGTGPYDDNPVSRLQGLKWLATQGKSLPPAVERILVMDASDLNSLPISNDDSNVPSGWPVDIEEFWKGENRKPTRVLLRHGSNALASQAAEAAASAAQKAMHAAALARNAIESGKAETAAESAIQAQEAALTASRYLQKEVQDMLDLKEKLTSMGVVVETLPGGEPIDVMMHLGKRSGYQNVVWRAGCWGDRGVESILAGAFQYISAHIAVDAVGGRFWQLMLAERCVQAACGAEQKVKIFAEQEDISLEYCDDEDADSDCVLTLDGRPIRHVRLDCRIGLVDEKRGRKLVGLKSVTMEKKKHLEDAPWFL